MKKWIRVEDSVVLEEDPTQVVFLIEDTVDEVINEVVALHNRKLDLIAINDYLMDGSTPCTPDMAIQIVGQIKEYIDNVKAKTEKQMETVVITDTSDQVEKKQNPGSESPDSPLVQKLKKRVQEGPTKKLSTSTLIETMKEKIKVAEFIEGIPPPEIPTEGISKGGRDILVALQKAIDKAKEDALVALQKL